MIQNIYEQHARTASDINEHLPTLKSYAEQCDSVVELGVRTGVSSSAFLAAKVKELRSYDLDDCTEFLKPLMDANKDTDWKFIQQSSLKCRFKDCDLLFIDTYHVYWMLKKELERHGNKAKKFIILHDTETFGTRPESDWYQYEGLEPDTKGLKPAIDEFLKDNPHWEIDRIYKNNNGLTILKRC